MSRKKILVVDDSRTALFMVTTILRKERYELVTASDGEEALAAAETERPDLILMDVVMPRKTGFEAVRVLRRQDGTKKIPVIMVTTRAEAKIIEICFQCGCNDYINKPVDGAVLLAKVRSILGN